MRSTSCPSAACSSSDPPFFRQNGVELRCRGLPPRNCESIRHVASVPEIANAGDPSVRPLQQHQINYGIRVASRIADEQGRTILRQPGANLQSDFRSNASKYTETSLRPARRSLFTRSSFTSSASKFRSVSKSRALKLSAYERKRSFSSASSVGSLGRTRSRTSPSIEPGPDAAPPSPPEASCRESPHVSASEYPAHPSTRPLTAECIGNCMIVARLADAAIHESASAGCSGWSGESLSSGTSAFPLAATQRIERGVVRDGEQPPFGLLMLPAEGRASAAFASASCTMSSPSKTDPTIRAQYRCRRGRIPSSADSVRRVPLCRQPFRFLTLAGAPLPGRFAEAEGCAQRKINSQRILLPGAVVLVIERRATASLTKQDTDHAESDTRSLHHQARAHRRE